MIKLYHHEFKILHVSDGEAEASLSRFAQKGFAVVAMAASRAYCNVCIFTLRRRRWFWER